MFLNEARAVLDRLETGVERASIAASQGLNRLRLGGTDAALVWFLPPVIDQFRKRFADIRLPLTEVSASKQQVQELLRHRIDVAFFSPSNFGGRCGLANAVLRRCVRCAACRLATGG